MKCYTGVGSRNTPPHMLEVIQNLAHKLGEQGWTMRSGGADGADTAFEMGSWERELYLPWSGFNGHYTSEAAPWCIVPSGELRERAMVMMEAIHPNWEACSKGARTLHARNVFQVLGRGLQSPSRMLICWAPTDKAGKPKGGTATAWKLAERIGIPCFNLNDPVHFTRIQKFIGE